MFKSSILKTCLSEFARKGKEKIGIHHFVVSLEPENWPKEVLDLLLSENIRSSRKSKP